MSLKAFHIFFITVSVLLCFGFGAWCLGSDDARGNASYRTAGWISFVSGAGLVVYEVVVVRKLKDGK